MNARILFVFVIVAVLASLLAACGDPKPQTHVCDGAAKTWVNANGEVCCSKKGDDGKDKLACQAPLPKPTADNTVNGDGQHAGAEKFNEGGQPGVDLHCTLNPGAPGCKKP